MGWRLVPSIQLCVPRTSAAPRCATAPMASAIPLRKIAMMVTRALTILLLATVPTPCAITPVTHCATTRMPVQTTCVTVPINQHRACIPTLRASLLQYAMPLLDVIHKLGVCSNLSYALDNLTSVKSLHAILELVVVLPKTKFALQEMTIALELSATGKPPKQAKSHAGKLNLAIGVNA